MCKQLARNQVNRKSVSNKVGSQRRDTYFDAWRGAAIVMVVAVHTYIASFSGLTDFYLLLRNACNACVPIFIAISGYFYTRKMSAASRRQTLIKQLKYVYLPTLVWSLPFFVLDVSGHGISLRSVVMLCCCGYSIYYFIAIIFQFYLLGPVLKPTKGTLITSVMVALVSIVVITYLIPYRELHLPLIVYASPFVLWVVFWCLGAYCGKHETSIPLIPLLILVVVLLMLSQLETGLLYRLHGTGFGFKLSSHLYSLALLCIMFSARTKSFFYRLHQVSTSWLSYLGRRSFAIYLIHMHVARHLLRHLPMCWMVRFVCLMGATLLMIELLRLVLGAKARYLGVR